MAAARTYVERIVDDKELDGMKALLLDSYSTKIVSMVYSQTQIIEKEVYLVQNLTKEGELMHHMKAAVFVQPTESNIRQLVKEVKAPRFSEYHIFFTNIVPQDLLVMLGKADEREVVKQVQEFYIDFLPVNEDLFHLGSSSGIVLGSPSKAIGKIGLIEQHTQGITSFLLSLKRRPADIRYQNASEICKKIAEKVEQNLHRDDLFHFRHVEEPDVIILDRRDDPITPLLTQWTYQAMIHELLGLNENRVSMKGAPGISGDMKELVLSSSQDSFYAQQRFANFGELGISVKKLMDDYQSKSKMNENISSIQDMQSFLERYPQFRSQSINVSKHVAIIGELARLIDVYKLFNISELEQDIACSSDHSKHYSDLVNKLNDRSVQVQDKLRLALIYIIRYESYMEVPRLKNILHDCGVPKDETVVLDAILAYAGEAKRAPGLFDGGGLIASLHRQITTSIHGVDNVFTQHIPLVSEIINSYSNASLSATAYPSVRRKTLSRAKELVIFIVGGVTYEEAAKVREFNVKQGTSMRVMLGGSVIHNSVSFINQVIASYKKH